MGLGLITVEDDKVEIDNLHELRQAKVLFEKYLEKFPSLALHWYEKNGAYQRDKKTWRERNLECFYQMGKEEGFECWSGKHEGEYHVDLCWYHGYPPNHGRNPKDWNQREKYMELALEHEQDERREAERIYYAFSKLFDVKAYIKVLMCFPSPKLSPGLPQALTRAVTLGSIKVMTETYLLIIFSEDKSFKPSEQLRIGGYSIDYQGVLTPLDNKGFPIRPEK